MNYQEFKQAVIAAAKDKEVKDLEQEMMLY